MRCTLTGYSSRYASGIPFRFQSNRQAGPGMVSAAVTNAEGQIARKLQERWSIRKHAASSTPNSPPMALRT